jgi:hypothetical protein
VSLPIADIIEVDSLWKSVVAAIAAGAGITLAFSLGLLGWIRAGEARRGGEKFEASVWTVVGAAGLLACAAGIVLGLILMTDK